MTAMYIIPSILYITLSQCWFKVGRTSDVRSHIHEYRRGTIFLDLSLGGCRICVRARAHVYINTHTKITFNKRIFVFVYVHNYVNVA